MASVKLDDSYGYLTFEFDPPASAPGKGVPAPPSPVRLDVWEANTAYRELHKTHEADPDAFRRAWRQWLYGRGFPSMSEGNALAVIRACTAEIERLGKAEAGSPTPG